jgi:CDP-paratose 2-epimerase
MTEACARRGLRTVHGGFADDRPVLITGGAGFVGTNLADSLLSSGRPVVVLDNLSRPGVEQNLRWLRHTHGGLLRIEVADVRDAAAVRRSLVGVGGVVHLAAQVAVTTSLADPRLDFDVNAGGTLNLLMAMAALDDPPPLLFTSTNKVYGGLGDIELGSEGRRYRPVDERIGRRGIDESRPLDFHSPYGCSKGAADQYVLDAARSFGLRTVVFRMSCIYGPHQRGTEDQGWLAHFLIRALRGETITLFGNGQQVRDVLFVEDLIAAFESAFSNFDAVAGQAFNIGGGPDNATSLLELLELLGGLCGGTPQVRFDAWRVGDQRYYVSDTTRFTALTGWLPRTGVFDGVERLYHWLRQTGPAGPLASAMIARWPSAGTAVAGAAAAAVGK